MNVLSATGHPRAVGCWADAVAQMGLLVLIRLAASRIFFLVQSGIAREKLPQHLAYGTCGSAHALAT